MSILNQFRIVSFIEGVSYLILLGFAMPMKYIYQNPVFVKFFGMVHGLVFILFIVFLFICYMKYRVRFHKSIKFFILSLIPFGFIWIDKELKNI